MSPPRHRRVFSSCRHPSRVQRDLNHLPAPSSAPRSSSTDQAARIVAIDARTSLGVRRSPSAFANGGRPYHPEIPPPARSVLRDSHPFDVLLHPSSGRACFIPSCAPGVHPFAALSHQPCEPFREIGRRRSRASSRPAPFRAPELRTGSFSRAFSPPAAAWIAHPDFLPCTWVHQVRFPGLRAPGASEFSPRKVRDVLGRLRGTRSLPS